ncbi:MAG: GNAT family N-acetyltransferase [Burkholderiaceae bacterium]
MSTQALSLSANYRTQVLRTLRGHEREWDALAAACAPEQVLLSSAFLATLEETGCVGGRTGWSPVHLLLHDAQGLLVAAAPLYLKQHSYGEYVFDHAWADAYARHGLAYYPKLLCALPFTPVPGTRLLARDADARAALAHALPEHTKALDASSCHVLFPQPHSAQALQDAGWLKRTGVQFHWQNAGYALFEDFLDSLEQKKRKNIRAERRKVLEAGVTFTVKDGNTASAQDWAFFTHCYNTTYTQHWSSPYLNLKFFELLGERAPDATVLFLAYRAGEPIAASLCIRSGKRLYGRYWGAIEHVPCLHFEACYYQPIQYAIAQGIEVFEGGAQGEHKIARGLAPVPTCSYHWLAEPAFADAIDRYLQRERHGMDAYLDELNERLPFKETL